MVFTVFTVPMIAVRVKGVFVRVPIGAHESEERAMGRAWWIALNALDKPPLERECLSMIHTNEKYDGMKYDLHKS